MFFFNVFDISARWLAVAVAQNGFINFKLISIVKNPFLCCVEIHKGWMKLLLLPKNFLWPHVSMRLVKLFLLTITVILYSLWTDYYDVDRMKNLYWVHGCWTNWFRKNICIREQSQIDTYTFRAREGTIHNNLQVVSI